MFKILDIKKEQENTDYFFIEVRFTIPDEEYLGRLGKYSKALMVSDIEKYEEYYNNLENLEYDEKPIGKEGYEIVFKRPSPYDLGLCKTVDIVGEDAIEQQEDGTYIYRDHISSNYITRAALHQINEMKDHMDRGFCRWGDYPEQVGAFRSGDSFHDFIGIIETLHRFWD